MDTLKEKTEQLHKLIECIETLKKLSMGHNESEVYLIKSTETLLVSEAIQLVEYIKAILSEDMAYTNEYLESVDRYIADSEQNETKEQDTMSKLSEIDKTIVDSIQEEAQEPCEAPKDVESFISQPLVSEIDEKKEVAMSDDDVLGTVQENISDVICQENQSKEIFLDIDLGEEAVQVDRCEEEIVLEDNQIEEVKEPMLFSTPVFESLTAVESKPKIADIKKSLSIADRFRFQREIFGNNGERMFDTLTKLNEMTSFEEAMDFVEKTLVFDRDNKTGIDFIDLLKRRFLV